MGRAKEIIVKVIQSKVANEFVKKHHYSNSYVQNSVLHFGCFLDNKLHGVLQYGNSIDKRNCIGFVDTGLSINEGWNSFLELNRKVNFEGAKKKEGHQLRYIYLIDKTCKLTVPVLPFSKIDELGAGMYKGEKVSLEDRKNAREV